MSKPVNLKVPVMPEKQKPELGLIPKKQWLRQRCEDIMDAIERYRNGKYFIPPEWVDELAEHIRHLDNERKAEASQ